jgi:tetratricopeptide (TPR) repeat protein
MIWRSIHLRRGGFTTLLVALVLSILACSASPAHAAQLHFGTQEYLRRIQDVTIKGPNGEELYLGYKYSFYSFIAPYSVSDDGYILGVKGQDKYFRLDRAKIEALQARGQLPSPLPPYELSTIDYAMGHLLWGLGVFMAGVIAFQLYNRRRWQRARPHFVSAIAHGEKGDLDRAIADYTRAIDIYPKFESALVNRGVTYQRRGEHDQAIADFTKAIKIGHKGVTALALGNRGISYQNKGDFARAIADHTQAIKVSKAPVAYFNRGNALAARGDYAGAIADYTKAIELQPNAAPAYHARGGAYQKQGDASLAEADYMKAREIVGAHGVATQ